MQRLPLIAARQKAFRRFGDLGGSQQLFKLTGQLAYANGSAVIGATVFLLDWPTMALVQTTLSDASGTFLFYTPHNTPYRCSFFLAGAPNFFGITDILVPS